MAYPCGRPPTNTPVFSPIMVLPFRGPEEPREAQKASPMSAGLSFLLIYQVSKPFTGLLGHHFLGPSLTLMPALVNFLHGFALIGPNILMLGWLLPPPSLISCSTYSDALCPPEGKSMAGHLCKLPGPKPRTVLGPQLCGIKMQTSVKSSIWLHSSLGGADIVFSEPRPLWSVLHISGPSALNSILADNSNLHL